MIFEDQDTAAVTVRAPTELDTSEAHAFSCAIEAALRSGAAVVRVDLRAVTFIDSSGIRALVDGAEQAGNVNARFVLVEMPARVRSVLELIGLGSAFVVEG